MKWDAPGAAKSGTSIARTDLSLCNISRRCLFIIRLIKSLVLTALISERVWRASGLWEDDTLPKLWLVATQSTFSINAPQSADAWKGYVRTLFRSLACGKAAKSVLFWRSVEYRMLLPAFINNSWQYLTKCSVSYMSRRDSWRAALFIVLEQMFERPTPTHFSHSILAHRTSTKFRWPNSYIQMLHANFCNLLRFKNFNSNLDLIMLRNDKNITKLIKLGQHF